MINMFFILSNGIAKKICPKKDDDTWLCDSAKGKTKPGVAMGLSALIGLVVAIALIPMYAKIKEWVLAADAASKDVEGAVKVSTTTDGDAKKEKVEVETVELTMMAKAKKMMLTSPTTSPTRWAPSWASTSSTRTARSPPSRTPATTRTGSSRSAASASASACCSTATRSCAPSASSSP